MNTLSIDKSKLGGIEFRQIQAALGLTQREMGELLGMTDTAISKRYALSHIPLKSIDTLKETLKLRGVFSKKIKSGQIPAIAFDNYEQFLAEQQIPSTKHAIFQKHYVHEFYAYRSAVEQSMLELLGQIVL